MDVVVSLLVFPWALYSSVWVSGEGRNEELIEGGRDGHWEACSEKISKVV